MIPKPRTMSLALSWRRLSCDRQRARTGERRSDPISAWLMVSDDVRPPGTSPEHSHSSTNPRYSPRRWFSGAMASGH